MKNDSYAKNDFLISKAFDLAGKGQFAEALEIYNQLISQYPVGELYSQRGLTYYSLGDFENAIADFTKAIDLESDNPDRYVNRGNAYLRIKDFEEALADYNKSIELSPKLVKAYNGRSVVYENMGRIDDACHDLMTAIELENTYGAPYFNLGMLYLKMKKYDEALVCVNKADQLLPNDPKILAALGDLHADLGDPNSASEYYLRAIDVDSENVHARQCLAWLLSTYNQPSARDGRKALSHATWCCEKTLWKDAASLQTLAAAYAECGNFDEAARWQSEALKLVSPKKRDITDRRLKQFQKGLPIRK